LFSLREHPLRRLRSQLIASFLLGFLGVVLAVGIPLLLIINRQAVTQSQLLLNQAVLSTRAFMASEHSDLESLALLVSQRPTLARLLEEQDEAALEAYRQTLQTGAGLDLLLICPKGGSLNSDTQDPAAELCRSETPSGYAAVSGSQDYYLFNSTELETLDGGTYRILIGKRLSLILARLQSETGLLYFLLRQGRFIASSDPALQTTPAQINELRLISSAAQPPSPLKLAGHQYLPGSLEIDGPSGLSLIAALNVDDQLAVRRNLILTLLLGMLLVVLMASLLGFFLSQRISRPMRSLAEAASGFRQGRMNAPVSVHSSIEEVNELANTLEDARVALQHSLHQLQAKTAWNETLLNSIVEGILTLDNQDRITYASDGLRHMIEADGEAPLTGRGIDEVFPAAEGDLPFSSQLPEVGQQRRVSVKLKSGQPRLLALSKARFIPPEAENANRALVIRDVSQDEYLHRLLGDFLANITHEFRTPLAALEASSELLLDDFRSLPEGEMEELLVSLNLGIIDLQTLIDNLIEAASIEAGRFKVSVKPVSFEGVLKDAFEMIQPLAKKYSLKLELVTGAGPRRVLADQRRSVQVLVNLLSNAIKHSPENGTIRVECREAGRDLCVEVSDEGGGFPEKQQKDLFRRFSHLEAPDERTRHGAGLGLSVVKAIVEAQQGQVGIRDTQGKGAAIWFTVPLTAGEDA